jgi:hypothetical protein
MLKRVAWDWKSRKEKGGISFHAENMLEDLG